MKFVASRISLRHFFQSQHNSVQEWKFELKGQTRISQNLTSSSVWLARKQATTEEENDTSDSKSHTLTERDRIHLSFSSFPSRFLSNQTDKKETKLSLLPQKTKNKNKKSRSLQIRIKSKVPNFRKGTKGIEQEQPKA